MVQQRPVDKIFIQDLSKGADKGTIVLETQPEQDQQCANDVPSNSNDEVQNYLSCRYVSASEACWLIFEFPIHYLKPIVQRLYFHLENEQDVHFRENETLPAVLKRTDVDGTLFVQWMCSNL